MRRHADIWFVLVNGAKARVLRYRSSHPGEFESVHEEESREAAMAAHDLVTDRPGRSHESASPLRHAIEGSDPHEAAMARFETGVADMVNRAASQDRFDGLVLVAPPRVLGRMRQALDDRARERLILEEGKDLLGLPDAELKPRLSALVTR
ncbi:host attachment protein (plasmid) [Skermanella mucosa]|uniref:host attachment protein n=1 Tax=Skermanella mucosa TaxID=1789672 RepID=UPI00192C34DB|nr:host attachment protein [Skermanella mucosa]UEM25302.1 host attachment protein [Skermanella mucosa]